MPREAKPLGQSAKLPKFRGGTFEWGYTSMLADRARSGITMARTTGAFWVLCIVTGIYGYFPAHGTQLGKESIVVGGAAYLVVTVLLYVLLRPVNQPVALIAAAFSLVGIAVSSDSPFYFGVQCILVGYLIMRSTFLPTIIGVLMMLAGLGQLFILSSLLPDAWTNPFNPVG